MRPLSCLLLAPLPSLSARVSASSRFSNWPLWRRLVLIIFICLIIAIVYAFAILLPVMPAVERRIAALVGKIQGFSLAGSLGGAGSGGATGACAEPSPPTGAPQATLDPAALACLLPRAAPTRKCNEKHHPSLRMRRGLIACSLS